MIQTLGTEPTIIMRLPLSPQKSPGKPMVRGSLGLYTLYSDCSVIGLSGSGWNTRPESGGGKGITCNQGVDIAFMTIVIQSY